MPRHRRPQAAGAGRPGGAVLAGSSDDVARSSITAAAFGLPQAILAYLALAALAVVRTGAGLPALSVDSSAYLAGARYLAGVGATPVVVLGEGTNYSWGYALLLAPIQLVTTDATTVTLAAMGVNAACGVALLVALRRLLLRHGGLRAGTATLATLAATAVPVTLLQVPHVWPEVALAAALAWCAVGALDVLDGRPRATAVLAAAALAAAALHGRGLVAVVVAVGALGWVAVRRRTAAPVLTAAALLAATALVLLADHLLDGQVNAVLPGRGPVSRDALTLRQTVAMSGGALWGLAAGSLGLALAAGGALLTREARLRRLGVVAIALLGGTIVAGSLHLTGVFANPLAEAGRADYFAYTRYGGVAVPVAVAAGVAAIAARPRAGVAVAGIGLAALGAGALAGFGWTAPGWVQRLSAIDLAALQGLVRVERLGTGLAVGLITLVAVGLAAALGALALRSARALAVGLLAASALVVGVGGHAAIRPFTQQFSATTTGFAAQVEAATRGAPVDVVAQGNLVETVNRLQLLNPDQRLRVLRDGRGVRTAFILAPEPFVDGRGRRGVPLIADPPSGMTLQRLGPPR